MVGILSSFPYLFARRVFWFLPATLRIYLHGLRHTIVRLYYVRKTLIKWQFSGNAVLPNPLQTASVNAHSGVQHITGDVHRMRPECCGLTPGLISVVLPVYDQAHLLDESIQSVLVQTYDNIELIIVNDGSTDGVETVLEKYLDHPKVRCFTQANQRLPKALSNGFSYARGEYWTWTSADNIMEPRMLELMVAKFQTEPDLGMVYADYFAIDDRGALLQDRSWRPHNRPNPASGEIRLPRTTEKPQPGFRTTSSAPASCTEAL